MHCQGLTAKGPPPVPRFFLFIKIALAVLLFGVFVAACFNVSQVSAGAGYGYFFGAGAGGLAIWTCIYTWIILSVEFFLGLRLHNAYFRIVFVALFLLDKIFLLTMWANAASGAAVTLGLGCGTDGPCSKYGGSLAAVAALGAFAWLLICAILVFYVLACLRDPTAAPNYQSTNAYAGGAGNAELGNVKNDGSQQPFVSNQPGYAQPAYGQTQYAPTHQAQSTPYSQ